MEANSRSSVNASGQTNLTRGNGQAAVAGQTQTNMAGNSVLASRLQSSGQSVTSGTVKGGSSSTNSNDALAGEAGSGRLVTSGDAASTGTVVRSSIADSAHLKPVSASASHNASARTMSGLQHTQIDSSSSTSSALNSRIGGEGVSSATRAVVQKK